MSCYISHGILDHRDAIVGELTISQSLDYVGVLAAHSVEELILLGDGDSEPVLTRFAMLRAARRYLQPGRIIRIAFAPAGADFNDVLRGAA